MRWLMVWVVACVAWRCPGQLMVDDGDGTVWTLPWTGVEVVCVGHRDLTGWTYDAGTSRYYAQWGGFEAAEDAGGVPRFYAYWGGAGRSTNWDVGNFLLASVNGTADHVGYDTTAREYDTTIRLLGEPHGGLGGYVQWTSSAQGFPFLGGGGYGNIAGLNGALVGTRVLYRAEYASSLVRPGSTHERWEVVVPTTVVGSSGMWHSGDLRNQAGYGYSGDFGSGIVVFEFEVRNWDGRMPAADGGTADDQYEEETWQEIVAWRGDWSSWQTATTGWRKAMFQNVTNVPYLLTIKNTLDGTGTSGNLRNDEGKIVDGVWEAVHELDGSTTTGNLRTVDGSVTDAAWAIVEGLATVIEELQTPDTIDTGPFNGPMPGPAGSVMTENFGDKLTGHGFSVFTPEGTDDTVAPVFSFSMPFGTWLGSAGFSVPASLDNPTFEVDGAVFAPYRATVHAIWLGGFSLFGLGRVWQELRKV